MGICLEQYRAVVGSHCHRLGFITPLVHIVTPRCHDEIIVSFAFLLVLSIILLRECIGSLRHVATLIFYKLSTNIHPNPGPTDAQITNKMSVCHANVRSLKTEGKLEELSLLADSENFDIITLSETWLDNSFPNELLSINGFQLPLRKDRETGQGGGVALYVKNNLPCRRCTDLEAAGSECIWAEITTNTGKLLIGVYYRPPGQSAADKDIFLDDLSHSISAAIELNPKILLITGDFNDRCQQWDSAHTDSELGQRLFDLLTKNSLHQLISEPTRVSEYSETLLDLMITDSPGYVLNSGVLSPISTSDHSVVFCSFLMTHFKDRPFKRSVWDYKRANFDDLNNTLNNAPWDTGLAVFDSINDSVSYWSDLFLDTCKQFIPFREVTIRPKDKPWITCEIKRLIKKRNRAWNSYKRLTSGPQPHTLATVLRIERLYQLYKRLRNFTVNSIKNSIRKYFDNIRSKLDSKEINPKKWWSLSKSILGCKLCQNIPTLVDQGKTVSSCLEKCEIFNAYFADQCKIPPDDDPIPLPDFTYRTEARLHILEAKVHEVEKILRSLKTSSACGPDGIGNILLKNCAPSIASSLTTLFNHCLSNSFFPDSWKKSNVCPVHKKSNKQLKENYRPISLLCNVSKVLERVVYNIFYEYLTSNNILSQKNSGFKKNDSTINQLASILHIIYNGLEMGREARMVFLDISKAFDRVWHTGLLFKLKQYGFDEPVLHFIECYLSNRLQRVTLGGQSSSWLPVEAGVPQGSILGPLLFLVYINDITDNITCDIRLFADDTSILEIVHDPNASAESLNTNLTLLHRWGKLWRMAFNAIKSISLIFSSKRNKPDHPILLIGNNPIPSSREHTHLGITLTSNLSWDQHITRITSKASQRLALLRRLKYKLSRNTLSKLYTTMIRPILEYGCVLFDNCSQHLSQSLETVQYEAARICLGALRHTPRVLLLKELRWHTLANRRKYFKLVLFYKMYNKLTPAYLYNLVPRDVAFTTGRLLRNRANLRQIKFSTRRFGESFLPSAIRLWNTLPCDVRDCTSLPQFKAKLKTLLLPVDKTPPYFLSGKRFPNICHTQLRFGCSTLNAHLHNSNIIPDASCSCLHTREDTIHFFLYCPLFPHQRARMLGAVCRLLAPGVNPNLLVHVAGDILVNIFLNGSEDLSDDDNLSVFESVQHFIVESRRFNF